MPRTVQVTLDGHLLDIPAFNFGQLEQLTEAFTGADSTKVAFAVLRIAWPRINTDVKLEDLAPTFDEMSEAVAAILGMSGMKANPPEPPGLRLVPPAAS